jgi:hypothetical protein
MTGEEAYLCRIDEREVDVWDYYSGGSVFYLKNSELPDWAWTVCDLAAMSDYKKPVWAVLDKDFTLIRFSKEE